MDSPILQPLPDFSVIRWKLKLLSPLGRTTSVDCLCDNGAHRIFLQADTTQALKLELLPVDLPTLVLLPDGSTIAVTHWTKPVTSEINLNQQYKAYLSYLVLPLKGIGAIFGMPWLHKHGAVIDHKDKTVKFLHCWLEVVLQPSNQVFPP